MASASFVVTVSRSSDRIDDLRAAVDAVGPGYSLVNKITHAQAALANNDATSSCSILSAFAHEVDAQSGKKIPADAAASLVADASRSVPCSAASPRRCARPSPAEARA